MGLKRFFDWVWYGENRAAGPYIDALYPYLHNLNAQGTYSSFDLKKYYSPEQALRISTVYTCVLVRAEALSTLPCNVMQSTAEGSRVAYNHPVYSLLKNKPNPLMTAATYWKTVDAQIDLTGDSFSIIRYSGRYQPKQIDLVDDPDAVSISISDSGSPVYTWKGQTYRDYEVLHFKDLTLDGIRGCSRIEYNSSTMNYAGKLRNYGSNAIGTKPPGYFTTEQNYETVKKQEQNLSDKWKTAISNGDTPTLPFGLQYKNLIINPGDAQYLDAVNATKEDIYGIFRVPPTLAQNYDRATFANAEQQDLVFIKHTMLPIITNIEQECNAKLFAESNAESANPFYVKFNVNAYLRGDFASRTAAYRALWERGLVTGNQIADFEDWNHFEGGERRFVPMNMIPLDKVDEFIDGLSEPVATNVADPGGQNDPNQDRALLDAIEINKNGIIYKNGHAGLHN